MRTLLFAVLCTTACTEPASLEQRTAAVTAGSVDLAHEAVVKVMRDGVFLCSGTVIAPHAVLTAAHCLADTGAYAIALDASTLAVSASVRHPQFQPTGTAFDIGVLITQEALPITPMPGVPFRGTEADVAGPLLLVGFGQTLEERAGDYRRSGTVEITNVGSSELTTIAAPAQACAGDSGGPLLVVLDGTEHVTGIVSTSATGCTSTGTATRVGYYHASFVEPVLAALDGALQPAGGRCYWDDQCESGRCSATSVFGMSLCTVACVADAECPGGACVAQTCTYDLSRFALGASCASDFDCASNMCSEERCTQPCSPLSAASCPADFTCVPTDDSAECQLVEESASCATTRGGGLGLMLLCALAACTRRRRR